jgi:hypothetical protein
VLNSHNAASREHRAFLEESVMQPAQQAASGVESHANDWQPQCQTSAPRCVVAFSFQSVHRATARNSYTSTKARWAVAWECGRPRSAAQSGKELEHATQRNEVTLPCVPCFASHIAA